MEQKGPTAPTHSPIFPDSFLLVLLLYDSLRYRILGTKSLNKVFMRDKLSLYAAQPTDQGTESVVFLLVAVGEGNFSFSHVHFLWCKKEKLCFKKGVKRQKL